MATVWRTLAACFWIAGCCHAFPARPQDAAPDEAAGPPAALVRLNIVALDSRHQTVRDLTSSDFRVFDHGKPQKIAIFRRNEKRLEKPRPLEPHTFTNRVSSAVPHATVILFDLLNDRLGARGYAQYEIVKSLEHLESSDNLYLYLLTMRGELHPVRPLPSPEAGPSPPDSAWTRQIGPLLDRAIRGVLTMRPDEMEWDVDFQIRTTYGALAALSSAVAANPGRKSIVWITHGIPIEIGPRRSGTGDWIDYSPYLRQLTARFDAANIALYPVVMSPPGMTPGTDADPLAGFASLDTLRQFADLTGGHVYMQDVRTAIHEAVDEARVGYLIAYAPSPAKWDGKYHTIRVTCARAGVRIETKKGYYANPPQALSADQRMLALRSAASSPFDAAEIGLRVTVLPGAEGPDSRTFRISPAARDLLWLGQDGDFRANLQVLLVELGAAGPRLAAQPVPITLRSSTPRPAGDAQAGLPIERDMPVSDAARMLKIIVLDLNSEAVGSVTVPAAVP